MYRHKFIALLRNGDETTSKTIHIPVMTAPEEVDAILFEHLNEWFDEGWMLDSSSFITVWED